MLLTHRNYFLVVIDGNCCCFRRRETSAGSCDGSIWRARKALYFQATLQADMSRVMALLVMGVGRVGGVAHISAVSRVGGLRGARRLRLLLIDAHEIAAAPAQAHDEDKVQKAVASPP